MTATPITLVERLFAHEPISPLSLASMTIRTRLTGRSTVASTLALSAIESNGAPGMRITAAASSATPMFAA
jgi:hypothetical protein